LIEGNNLQVLIVNNQTFRVLSTIIFSIVFNTLTPLIGLLVLLSNLEDIEKALRSTFAMYKINYINFIRYFGKYYDGENEKYRVTHKFS
jgi:hypothetical protein